MLAYGWYAQLVKPAWAPPALWFGPVWTVLYVLIAVSFGAVFVQVAERKLPWKVAVPFELNLVFNFVFTPLQFGLRSNTLAAADVLLVLATLIWAMTIIWPRMRWVALASTPYLVWVCFATALQLTVTWLNWGR